MSKGGDEQAQTLGARSLILSTLASLLLYPQSETLFPWGLQAHCLISRSLLKCCHLMVAFSDTPLKR